MNPLEQPGSASDRDTLSSTESAKKEGWENFLHELPALMERDEPTRRLWPVLHRIVTRGADKEPVPEYLRAEAAIYLFTQGNPNVKTEADTRAFAHEAVKYAKTTLPRFPSNTAAAIHLTALAFDSKRKTEIDARLFMPRRGHLRKWGEVGFGGKERTPVTAPHSIALTFDLPKHRGESVFIGLAKDLKSVTDELCDRADGLLAKATTLEEKLQAMVYFQLWGLVIHPFMDGNGRALAAKLVLDLNKIGAPITELPRLPELKEDLIIPAAGMFLPEFVFETKMPLLTADAANKLLADPRAQDAYMDMLLERIQKGIRLGIPKNGFVRDAIERGVEMLKLTLSRDFDPDQGYYREHIGPLIAYNRSGRQE